VGTIDGSAAFREYAQRQVDCADVFLGIHTEAGLDLCRLHPCDDRRYWLGIRAHHVRLVEAGREPGGRPVSRWPGWSERSPGG
jgi:hypothetical protein